MKDKGIYDVPPYEIPEELMKPISFGREFRFLVPEGDSACRTLVEKLSDTRDKAFIFVSKDEMDAWSRIRVIEV